MNDLIGSDPETDRLLYIVAAGDYDEAVTINNKVNKLSIS